MKTKKIQKKDLESINQLQNQFNELTRKLGVLQIDEQMFQNQLKTIDTEKNNIFQQIDETRNAEEELLNSLKEKYGNGQINIQEGTFTPNT
jgi:TolA-binding protein